MSFQHPQGHGQLFTFWYLTTSVQNNINTVLPPIRLLLAKVLVYKLYLLTDIYRVAKKVNP